MGEWKQFWLTSLEKQFHLLKESSGSFLVIGIREAANSWSVCRYGPASPPRVVLPEIITSIQQTLVEDHVFSSHGAILNKLIKMCLKVFDKV